jgi:polar amino acid transport system permease protein
VGQRAAPRQLGEAAAAFGVSQRATFRAIELPQALAFALPLIANQTILVIKESAVASIITVPELTMTASDVVASTYVFYRPVRAADRVLLAADPSAVSLLAQRATARFPFCEDLDALPISATRRRQVIRRKSRAQGIDLDHARRNRHAG